MSYSDKVDVDVRDVVLVAHIIYPRGSVSCLVIIIYISKRFYIYGNELGVKGRIGVYLYEMNG